MKSMTHWTACASLLTACCLLAGCGEKPGGDTPNPKPPVTGDDVKRELGEAGDAALRYTEQQSAELREQVKTKLAEMDVEIERMKAKAAEMSGEAKVRMEEKINDLSAERAKVEVKLEELRNASGKAWTELKSGFDKSWVELKSSFQKASEEFRSAPKE